MNPQGSQGSQVSQEAISFTIIHKNGSLETKELSNKIEKTKKNFLENILKSKIILDLNNVKKESFKEIAVFKTVRANEYVGVLGFLEGEEKTANMYDFLPPPADGLYYGIMIVIKFDKESDELINFPKKDFKNFIELIHKGFDTLDSQEELSSDDESDSNLSGFIVRDSDYSESDYSDSDSE
jgi:ABC-type antimicrobial peptide transport system permease subunit